jgi:mannose-6-phosphate isomerase-like protein (cupin superfamily)
MSVTPLPVLRRIVTGVNSAGRSVIVEDGAPPVARKTSSGRPGAASRRVWVSFDSPAKIDDPDRTPELPGLMPPAAGNVMTYVDFPPEPKDPAERAKLLEAAQQGKGGPPQESGLKKGGAGAPHHGMHTTDTLDYAIVLSGEIYAIVDEGETLMKTGDILIQRGTSHSWDNRSDEVCRVLFVMMGAVRGT